MQDRRKTITAIAIIVGFLVLIIVGISVIVSGRRIVSPVPEEQGIKIIFLTPTPTVSPMVLPTSGTPKKSS